MLLAYSWAICEDFHLAEDVVQRTSLIAYKKLDLFFVEADFACWLKAIARREALDVRKRQRRQALSVADEVLEAAFDDPSPSAVSPERDALPLCLDLLRQSNQRSAQIIHLRYFEGATVAEIGSKLALNCNTVKTLLYRARLRLQDCIHRHIPGGAKS